MYFCTASTVWTLFITYLQTFINICSSAYILCRYASPDGISITLNGKTPTVSALPLRYAMHMAKNGNKILHKA